MKKPLLILILIWSLSLAGCSKDTQANAFMKEYAAVTAQVAEKLTAGDPDTARALFESKKPSLNAKWDAVKRSLPFQLSAETKRRMNSEPEEDMTAVVEAANKAIGKNPKSEAQVQALVLDLANVFRR